MWMPGLFYATTCPTFQHVYPNPATTEETVSFEGMGGEYVVSIMEITGRVYVTQSVANASGIQTVKLDASGVTLEFT